MDKLKRELQDCKADLKECKKMLKKKSKRLEDLMGLKTCGYCEVEMGKERSD